MALQNDAEKLLDATGWQIIQALQKNARLSYHELGRRVGLTAPAVAERVRKLEEAGIIMGYMARINPAKGGTIRKHENSQESAETTIPGK